MDYKLKNKLLLVGFIISLILIYQFAIVKTIEAKKVVSILRKENALLHHISENITYLKKEEIVLDSILKSVDVSIDNSFQQTLLQKITVFTKKNKLQIIAFKEPHQLITNNTKLSTYAFEVKGTFISLLKMVNYIEQLQLGELISIEYKKKKNYRTNSNYLICKIFLQKISS
jgi:hypothetical protein